MLSNYHDRIHRKTPRPQSQRFFHGLADADAMRSTHLGGKIILSALVGIQRGDFCAGAIPSVKLIGGKRGNPATDNHIRMRIWRIGRGHHGDGKSCRFHKMQARCIWNSPTASLARANCLRNEETGEHSAICGSRICTLCHLALPSFRRLQHRGLEALPL